MLLHINRLLGSDFDIAHWQHRVRFDVGLSRIEMHLDALQDQRVQWPGGQRWFRRGESIHTENSYKYSVAGFQALARRAGWAPQAVWIDGARRFSLHWLQPASTEP